MPDYPNRQSIRLRGYDYSQQGAYFVTLCSFQREHLFGDVVGDTITLNPIGQAVAEAWLWLAERYAYVDLDAWIVMPNHLHGILVIHDDLAMEQPKSLGRLIGAFKVVSTKRANLLRDTDGHVLWQRNFYEHVIRSEKELNVIRQYIALNPSNWEQDTENTHR